MNKLLLIALGLLSAPNGGIVIAQDASEEVQPSEEITAVEPVVVEEETFIEEAPETEEPTAEPAESTEEPVEE